MKRIGLAFLLLTLLAPCAHAETYRVDLIVFLDKAAAGETGRRPVLPNMSRAIDLSDTAALRSAGIVLLSDEQFGLGDAWSRLKNSKRYQPVIRLAWVQKDPPADKGASLHLQWGNPLSGGDGDGLTPVDGTVTLLAGRYLHLDTYLLYTQALSEGGRVSFRLKENRLMRRDELHHLDSPKLGVLARVVKAGG